MSNQSNNPWDWDLRVRDRHLRSGKLNDGELKKFLQGLSDLSSEVEQFSVIQPGCEEEEEEELLASDEGVSQDS